MNPRPMKWNSSRKNDDKWIENASQRAVLKLAEAHSLGSPIRIRMVTVAMIIEKKSTIFLKR